MSAISSEADMAAEQSVVRLVPKLIGAPVAPTANSPVPVATARLNALPVKSLVSVARRAHNRSTTRVILCNTKTRFRGVICLALIAFLFCLEIYQAEQQRKRKLH